MDRQSGGETMPLGLSSLAAVTRANGYETHIVDSGVLGLTLEQTSEAMLCHKLHVVGFTAVTISVHNAATVAGLIKKKNNAIITLLGGYHITAVPEETMQLD